MSRRIQRAGRSEDQIVSDKAMRLYSILLPIFLATAAAPAAASCESLCKPGEPNRDLLEVLKKDHGVILVLRHTAKCRGECPDTEDRDDCLKPEAGLTQTGRDQAAAIRDGLAAAGFTFSEIDSSRYCRTVQGAEILSGRPVPAENRRAALEAAAGLAGVRERPERHAGNRILVTHSNVIEGLEEECLAEFDLEADEHYGIALVYAAEQEGNKRVLQGCVWPGGWGELTTPPMDPDRSAGGGELSCRSRAERVTR